MNSKYVDTTYKHIPFGNKIEANTKEDVKSYKYNDKNQVKTIETDKGIIKYDDNGNVSKKINEDEGIDSYFYDKFNQLHKDNMSISIIMMKKMK